MHDHRVRVDDDDDDEDSKKANKGEKKREEQKMESSKITYACTKSSKHQIHSIKPRYSIKSIASNLYYPCADLSRQIVVNSSSHIAQTGDQRTVVLQQCNYFQVIPDPLLSSHQSATLNATPHVSSCNASV